jgi:hypothetical protein
MATRPKLMDALTMARYDMDGSFALSNVSTGPWKSRGEETLFYGSSLETKS